jgi:hypothetical protein
MARKKVANKAPATTLGLQGFHRIQLKEDGKVVGDSGWVGPNCIVDAGIQLCLMGAICATAGSFQIAAMAVGTGTYPASNATSIGGEYGGTAVRCAITAATTQRSAVDATATLQFAGSWASSKCSAASTIQNIGLFNVSNAQGSMLCGNTYATSQWNTNQDLYASYQVRLSFTT